MVINHPKTMYGKLGIPILLGMGILLLVIGFVIIFYVNRSVVEIENKEAPINELTIPTEIVEVTNDGFDPSQVTIPAGGQVMWHNVSDETISIEPKKEYGTVFHPLSQGEIQPGGSDSLVFDVSDEYEYYDPLHPDHTGIITVE